MAFAVLLVRAGEDMRRTSTGSSSATSDRAVADTMCTVADEAYTAPPVTWHSRGDGRRRTAAEVAFTHAIRRADGSLLYRATSVEHAVAILERLIRVPS